MKEQFENRKLNGSIQINLGTKGVWVAEKVDLVKSIIEITNRYMNNNDVLSLRQLYYQLVAAELIPNHDKVYKKIGEIKDDCCYCGLLDWDAFEDRGRRPYLPYFNEDIKDAIKDAVDHFRLDRQRNQNVHIEIWSEKDAISSILSSVTNKYHVRLVVNKGYISSSAIYAAYVRFIGEIAQGKKVKILYFGDHDPSGLDMIRDINDRILMMCSQGLRKSDLEELIQEWVEENRDEAESVCHSNGYFLSQDGEEYYFMDKAFFHSHFEIIPVGLTMEQIKMYNPPPNPAKITDPRAKEYIKKFGNVSWEVDALTPEMMREIVTTGIEANIDKNLFNIMINKEKADKIQLAKLAETLK
jgi:hypothetical protein